MKVKSQNIIAPVLLVLVLVGLYLLLGTDLLRKDTATREVIPGETGNIVKYGFEQESTTAKAPLRLPVADEVFYDFIDEMQRVTTPLAAADNLPHGRPEYFSYSMPAAIDPDSADPAERYLAGRLTDSVAHNYDFSMLVGREIAGCVFVYGDAKAARVYIGLCGENGEIAGLWADDYAKPEDDSQEDQHWSVLNLETKRLQ